MLSAHQMAELDSIASKSADGMLRASAVVKAAENPKSALHKRFEWDDSKAAKLYRMEQARSTIEIYVEVTSGVESRAYVSLKADRTSGGGYRRTSDAMDNPITRDMLVDQLRADLQSVLRRYSYLRHLASDVFEAVDAVVMRRSKAS